MKKLVALSAFFALLLSSLAMAATDVASNYYSGQHPLNNTALKAKNLYPATDITVSNSTTDIIYATVPGTPVYDMLYPNNNDHIYNDSYYGMTRVVLQDPYRYPFFDGYVCRYAIVSVYGYPGSYNVYVNSNYCY